MKPITARRHVRHLWDQLVILCLARGPRLGKLGKMTLQPKLTENNFATFTYSRRSHFSALAIPEVHQNNHFSFCDLKVYQDSLVYTFLCNNFKPGAKFLEIGGGTSRVIHSLKQTYEFWNLDKFEGLGHGPTQISSDSGFITVKDYIGKYNSSLPENYFDCVFSISTLEHVPEDADSLYCIMDDIHRVLKPGGYSLHCIDVVLQKSQNKGEKIIAFFYDRAPIINPFIGYEIIRNDPDLWSLPLYAYYSLWVIHTKKTHFHFGVPFSYNILWKKDNLVPEHPV